MEQRIESQDHKGFRAVVGEGRNRSYALFDRTVTKGGLASNRNKASARALRESSVVTQPGLCTQNTPSIGQPCGEGSNRHAVGSKLPTLVNGIGYDFNVHMLL